MPQKFSTNVIERKKKSFPLEIRSTHAYGINHQSSFPREFSKNIFLSSLNFASASAVKSINWQLLLQI